MRTLLRAVSAGTILVGLGCQAEVPEEEHVGTIASGIDINCTVYYWDNMQCTVCYWPNGCRDWSCVDNNGIFYSDSACP